MFFLARSALCIGLVAVAASHVGAADVATALDGGLRQAADTAGRACLRSSDCLRVGAAALAAAAAPAGSIPDTRLPRGADGRLPRPSKAAHG